MAATSTDVTTGNESLPTADNDGYDIECKSKLSFHQAGKMDIIPTKNKNLICVKLTSVGIPPKKNLKNFISDKTTKHLTL